jgi:hypothetical protein
VRFVASRQNAGLDSIMLAVSFSCVDLTFMLIRVVLPNKGEREHVARSGWHVASHQHCHRQLMLPCSGKQRAQPIRRNPFRAARVHGLGFHRIGSGDCQLEPLRILARQSLDNRIG